MKNFVLSCLFLALATAPLSAEEARRIHGGDYYIAGDTVLENLGSPRDVFMAGSVIATSGTVAGDIHIAGYNVDVTTLTGADLYVFGSSITLAAPVGEDTTMAGYSIHTRPAGVTAGNARLFGQTVRVEGAVNGALIAFGNTVVLNAPVAGDVWIAAGDVSFGPDARIDGQLTLTSDDAVDVPDRVIPADRVRREDWDRGSAYHQIRQNWDRMDMPGPPGWLAVLSVFFIGLLFLVILAAIVLRFWGAPVDRMRQAITDRPFHAALLGIGGLSAVFGLVPVTALTVAGLPFVPVAVLLVLVVWNLGYLLAAFALALWVLRAITGASDPSLPVKLAAIAVVIPFLALLNFIPVLGWVVNYTLVLLGVGGVSAVLYDRLTGTTPTTLDETV